MFVTAPVENLFHSFAVTCVHHVSRHLIKLSIKFVDWIIFLSCLKREIFGISWRLDEEKEKLLFMYSDLTS